MANILDPNMLSISKRYTYTPVDATNDEIRVLMLLPGPFDAELRVELTSIRFPPTQPRPPLTEERRTQLLARLRSLQLFVNQFSGHRPDTDDPERTIDVDPMIPDVFFHNASCDGCEVVCAS
jgi:hypothetical protein